MTRICLSKVTIEDLRKFGMIPEFIGRLPMIFTLKGLDRGDAGKDTEGAEKCDPKAVSESCWHWMRCSLEFDEGGTGSDCRKSDEERRPEHRALRAIIEEFMLDIMYEIPKDDNIGTVTITREYIEGSGRTQD